MNRQSVIQDIDALFPADAPYEDTAAIGQELMKQAMDYAGFNWRQLPDNVLSAYRMLCIQKENDQIRRAELKRHGYYE